MKVWRHAFVPRAAHTSWDSRKEMLKVRSIDLILQYEYSTWFQNSHSVGSSKKTNDISLRFLGGFEAKSRLSLHPNGVFLGLVSSLLSTPCFALVSERLVKSTVLCWISALLSHLRSNHFPDYWPSFFTIYVFARTRKWERARPLFRINIFFE